MIMTAVNVTAGAIIGWLIPWLDRIAYIYILHPETQAAQFIKYQINQRCLKSAWNSLNARAREFDQLTSRGILFQLVWAVLAFFVITSSAGWLGKSLVLALGARLLTEQWRGYFADRAGLKRRLLWQVKADWSDREVKLYLLAMSLLVAWLGRLAI